MEAPAEKSLCVLGAGNAYDLDLAALAAEFSEIHLVDLDVEAVRGACERQDEPTRRRLTWHAPLELSGMHERLARWARMELTPEELFGHAAATAQGIQRALGRRFDVVLSACVLSQMQLSLVRVLGDRHRLFEALRVTLNVTHLRTLMELTAPLGRALFVTDSTSDAIAPFGDISPGEPAIELLGELSRAGAVFAFAEPSRLRALFQEDPALAAAGEISDITDAWIWQNGLSTRFLVYALELQRKSRA